MYAHSERDIERRGYGLGCKAGAYRVLDANDYPQRRCLGRHP